jgi:integral membrane protein (TIGR01906 family)
VENTNDPSTWQYVASKVLQMILPIITILTSVLLMLVMAKSLLQIEYRLPGFPEDRYGFNLEDRVYWASIDIEYLIRDYEPAYFDDFLLEDGSPMHNERELKHLEDVKRLVRVAWKVWAVGVGIVLFLIITLWRVGETKIALRGVLDGSRLTLIMMGILMVGVMVAFGVLFVGFHKIFFEGSTWIFPYSDTFIRLYPERLWRDTFIIVGLITVIEAAVLHMVARRLILRTDTS